MSLSGVLAVLGDPKAPPGPKALDAPNAEPEPGCPKAVEPKAGDLAPPKAEIELVAGAEGVDDPNADDPNAGLAEPNADLPNAEVEVGATVSVLGVLAPEAAGDPKADEEPKATVGLVVPNPELDPPNPPPKVGSFVVACPNPNAGLDPLVGVPDPNALVPNLLLLGAGTCA